MSPLSGPCPTTPGTPVKVSQFHPFPFSSPPLPLLSLFWYTRLPPWSCPVWCVPHYPSPLCSTSGTISFPTIILTVTTAAFVFTATGFSRSGGVGVVVTGIGGLRVLEQRLLLLEVLVPRVLDLRVLALEVLVLRVHLYSGAYPTSPPIPDEFPEASLPRAQGAGAVGVGEAGAGEVTAAAAAAATRVAVAAVIAAAAAAVIATATTVAAAGAAAAAATTTTASAVAAALVAIVSTCKWSFGPWSSFPSSRPLIVSSYLWSYFSSPKLASVCFLSSVTVVSSGRSQLPHTV
ncbi:unnamed protein product [Closterium sp. NIES-64]|nr:unnamed protein product [Closterium sp. NIES-64]